MDMLNLTKQELEKHNAFDKTLSPIVQRVIEAIPFETVPKPMKATIAISEITTFASQFRRNLMLWDDTSVPINSISFVLTGSGQNKDSSVRAARKCFTIGYSKLEEQRKLNATKAAQEAAREAGEDLYEEWDTYKAYYKKPPAIFMAPTTEPGFVQHANDINEHALGGGMLYSGEFGDELAYNGDMLSNIKVLSEIYDLGEKEAKYTKGVEHRSEAISGQPVSALFVGSPTFILYDESTKKKFNIAFMSKLARRSWFCYVPEVLPMPSYPSIDKMLEAEERIDRAAKEARLKISDGIEAVTAFGLKTAGEDIAVSDEVYRLFKTYLRYNTEVSNVMPNPHSTAVLVRKHLQWKALKLAGAIAIFNLSGKVTADHYVEAIRFCELLADDMGKFEGELSKFDYERFADYIQTIVNPEGVAIMSVHDIKKMGFTSSIAKAKLAELITASAAYDKNGVYSLVENDSAIRYETIIKTDSLNISFKAVDNSPIFEVIKKGGDHKALEAAKTKVATTANSGLSCEQTTFAELGELLQGDFAYSPFCYSEGIRRKENLIGGTKWLVLDIDDSKITASEAHFILGDINHHVALSSNADNEFKFRVLIELDSVVDVSPIVWKYFFLAIAEDLSLTVDALPQSQLFFSYSGREVLSTIDAEPLPVRDYLMQAIDKTEHKPEAAKDLTTPQKQALLNDELTTFSRAFEAADGEGSRKLIWAAKKAHLELSMPLPEVEKLIHRINQYWTYSMDEDRLERTILSQIRRW